MKKLRPPYLIVTLLLVLFASSITLPFFTAVQKNKTAMHRTEKKLTKESKETDFYGENENTEYLSDTNLLNQSGVYFPIALIRFVDEGSFFTAIFVSAGFDSPSRSRLSILSDPATFHE